MEDKYLIKLKNYIIDTLKEERVKIILFGSRARKDNQNTSDVDIGIIPYDIIDKYKITKIKTDLEDLNIPYKVEIVNFNEVSEDFKKEALKEVIIWKD